jgi:hypothetical protein
MYRYNNKKIRKKLLQHLVNIDWHLVDLSRIILLNIVKHANLTISDKVNGDTVKKVSKKKEKNRQ